MQWQSWRPASCLPDACFCEAIRDGVIRQPANTFSSLAFVLVAIVIFRTGRLQGAQVALIRLYAFTLLVIGLGSAFYHASLTFAGQFIDVLGMYLLATLVIAHGAARLNLLKGAGVVTAYLGSNLVLAWVLYAAPLLRRYLFALLILTGLGLELRARQRAPVASSSRLRAALLWLSVGFALWVLDITHLACLPHSLVQGHAVWHILGAAASWEMYRYLVSD